jgi:hypothetical protein
VNICNGCDREYINGYCAACDEYACDALPEKTLDQFLSEKPTAPSTEAARMLCKEIVVATSSTIQGKRYVAVEGWQAIARAHGCAAGATDVERVEGGVRATGEVRDILTGS